MTKETTRQKIDKHLKDRELWFNFVTNEHLLIHAYYNSNILDSMSQEELEAALEDIMKAKAFAMFNTPLNTL
tara:strand:+ start:204 stop:419 length:216 start_codon:yes stop_codon:yes gene_type:complete